MGEETTTIEVKISTYKQLNGRKLPGESFDDVVSRLLEDDRPTPHAPSEPPNPGGHAVQTPEEPDSPPPKGRGSADESGRATGGSAVEQTDDPLDVLLGELDLPGGERRVEAVRACVEYLCVEGVASRSDFIADVYPEHRTGVGEGRWWDVVGKQGLREVAEKHPHMEPPAGEGAHNYEWIGR